MLSRQEAVARACAVAADDSHGYSQHHRDGDPDFDCSSLGLWVYGLGTDGYSGNICDIFADAGADVYEYDGNLIDLEAGDLLVKPGQHVAIYVGGGDIVQASIDEHGGVAGDNPGDQTGTEIYRCGVYEYPGGWDYVISPPGGGAAQDTELSHDPPPDPRYRAYIREDGWLDWMQGLCCTGGSSDDYAGVAGCWIYDMEFEGLGGGGWYELERADGSKSRNSSGNVESPVTGVVVYYTTDTDATGGVYYKAKYQAHWLGLEPGWGKWELDDEDSGAGKDRESPLDMFRLALERE